MERRAYYDAEPRYKKEKTTDWYQQSEKTNQSMREQVVEYLSPKNSVLEVACGGGWLAHYVLSSGVKAYAGFDYSETAVQNARTKLASFEDAKVWRADALSPLAYRKKYDLIIAHQFLHCLVGKDRETWLKNCRSALHSDGVLIFTSMVGTPESLVDNVDAKSKINKAGNRYYAEESEIVSEVIGAGFEIEEIIHPEDFSAIFVASPTLE